MSRGIKKQLSFFLIVICGVGIYNYIATRQKQNNEVNVDVQQRERDFMEKRAEYIHKHGDTSAKDQEIQKELALRRGHSLIDSSSSIKDGQDTKQSVE
ncbi:hypothetical protein LIS44_03970 [Acinetobacter haemolyticus]|uniref:hypothetical protein n=1 Tax=Acinetobacter sp. CS-2 TaxID=2798861 RepID=UPI00190577E7|nr:hypothetical protein [Acinetobacter sp. CS-2]QQN38713.1 hypothetical protein JFY49_11990 [Acinetobacter sp. CS-2]UDM38915.1 hypothetical protein LIS44_03970 [Acinetobacter haemolyticus]